MIRDHRADPLIELLQSNDEASLAVVPTPNPFLATIEALSQSQCRFVIVGGFAVVMYGSNRFTPDVNIAVDLDEDNLRQLLSHLLPTGLAPLSGSSCADFIDPGKREKLWSEVKSKSLFFSLRNFEFPCFSVDLFYRSPLSFAALYQDAIILPFGHCTTRICSVEHLIEMKQLAGRSQDFIDIENLEAIRLIAPRLKEPDFDPRQVPGLPPLIDSERAADLAVFIRTSPAKKIKWLKDMLDALGAFCSL